ncbi:unnamed protein product [Medioppia subpectinata]|uniref:Uncharacterized protein n=1 Tax=Medioppia subpectinata TaxID=1979941 RepID=A0A7R9KT78_9ACAR|nr:unnamed protein product [Medioppia subpectinata]CAG2109379.1 unnamed protein product [Medioppia subpectinata]
MDYTVVNDVHLLRESVQYSSHWCRVCKTEEECKTWAPEPHVPSSGCAALDPPWHRWPRRPIAADTVEPYRWPHSSPTSRLTTRLAISPTRLRPHWPQHSSTLILMPPLANTSLSMSLPLLLSDTSSSVLCLVPSLSLDLTDNCFSINGFTFCQNLQLFLIDVFGFLFNDIFGNKFSEFSTFGHQFIK